MNRFPRIILTISICMCIAWLSISCAKPKYTGLEAKMDYSLDEYATRIAHAHKMKLLIVGDVTSARDIPPKTSASYCLSFSTHLQQSLEEGRIFAANLVEDFWKELKQNPEVIKYAKNSHITLPSFPKDILLKQLGYKISYWDEDMNRQQKPYLAEIHFYHEKFYYYYADPNTHEIVLALEESYQDAIHFRNTKNRK